MWKVVSFFVYALDRVVDNPQSWVFDNDNSEVLDCLAAAIAEQDAVLLGRATYEAWSAFWPTSTDQPFADFINHTPKYAVTRRPSTGDGRPRVGRPGSPRRVTRPAVPSTVARSARTRAWVTAPAAVRAIRAAAPPG